MTLGHVPDVVTPCVLDQVSLAQGGFNSSIMNPDAAGTLWIKRVVVPDPLPDLEPKRAPRIMLKIQLTIVLGAKMPVP